MDEVAVQYLCLLLIVWWCWGFSSYHRTAHGHRSCDIWGNWVKLFLILIKQLKVPMNFGVLSPQHLWIVILQKEHYGWNLEMRCSFSHVFRADTFTGFQHLDWGSFVHLGSTVLKLLPTGTMLAFPHAWQMGEKCCPAKRRAKQIVKAFSPTEANGPFYHLSPFQHDDGTASDC